MDRATLQTLDRETLVELVLHLVAEQATVIAALQEQVAALQRENAELRARLGQNSSNSSRPPSSDLPGARPAAKRTPSGRRAGGQPGHPGHQRVLLPREQVDSGDRAGPGRLSAVWRGAAGHGKPRRPGRRAAASDRAAAAAG